MLKLRLTMITRLDTAGKITVSYRVRASPTELAQSPPPLELASPPTKSRLEILLRHFLNILWTIEE